MNAKQFGEKYGKKYSRRIPVWYALGYLGNTTKDEKTGVYTIPDDIPLPYTGHKNVTRLPTLWMEILDAASCTQSMFGSMYPKLSSGVFDRQLTDFETAKFIRISKTKSGDSYLELLPTGYNFMHNLTVSEKKEVFVRANELIKTGCSVAQALAAVLFPFFAVL